MRYRSPDACELQSCALVPVPAQREQDPDPSSARANLEQQNGVSEADNGMKFRPEDSEGNSRCARFGSYGTWLPQSGTDLACVKCSCSS